MLTTEKVDTTSGAFLFVGRDAYEAKGGTITIDLFSQGAEGFADDPELVRELAEKKLDTIADQYRAVGWHEVRAARSEEHTSELQSLMRSSYAVFCLKKKNRYQNNKIQPHNLDT